MQNPNLSRRQLLVAGGATLAMLALFNARFAAAVPLQQGDELLPWLDQPAVNQEPEGIVSMNTKTLKPGVYTIQQKSSGRYVDAHKTKEKDFALITRHARDYVPNDGHLFFDPPTWVITPVGGVYTIQQKSSGQFVDAHEIWQRDYAVVTRPEQNNDTQKWIINPLGDNTFTIQQKSRGRFVEAYTRGKDFALVTRRAKNNDNQRWIILEFFPEG